MTGFIKDFRYNDRENLYPVLSSEFHVLLLIRASPFSLFHLPSNIPFFNFWGVDGVETLPKLK
jgi:hypothetical protein